ncbi:neuromedin-U receptor 2-like [Ruditapes philippinarum]|uniref:neuromedin-U receptor 2-like n=1 Tax=Ruditapes philippinarum TaxID=129788 RepID=UPI00295B2A99|nr:neuromedin-U receptor 2-like [Ruditapes philippinarum]
MENISLALSMEHFNDSNNNTDNSSDIPPEPPLYIVLTSTLLYVLIFLVGILGNILVIIVITFSHSMKTTVNMYLMNLCVADILVIIVCMPTALADIFTKEVWYFGEAMCKAVPFLEHVVANASVLTILAISIERYRVVCYPLEVRNEEIFRVWKVVAVIWVLSVGFSLPWLSIPIVKNSQFLDGTPIQVCRIPIIYLWQEIFIVVLAFLFFLLPCITLFLLNCHLCRVLNQASDYEMNIHQSGNDRRKRQNQVANIIASIVTVFFICHLPFRIAGLWLSFADPNTIGRLGLERYLGIVYSTRILFYLNHALNPVVYNFVSTKFRCALRDLFANTICSRVCNLMISQKQKVVTATATTKLTVRKNTSLKDHQNNSPVHGRTTVNDKDSEHLLDKEYKLKINFDDKRVAIKFNFVRQAEEV